MSSRSSTRNLRSSLRRNRRALPNSFRQQAAEDLCSIVTAQAFFLRAKRIAFYLASDGEIDPWLLQYIAQRRGKQVYLPVVSDRLARWQSSPLSFLAVQPGERLVRNRFGILEPPYDPAHVESTWMLDVILLPLVGFDRHGTRLGMGAGFYDRALANLGTRFRRPLLVGLGYAMQELDEIELQEWDVALDAVATEKEFIWTS